MSRPIRVTLADALRSLPIGWPSVSQARSGICWRTATERIEVVVRFLAVLELYREGKVELSQADVFGDIEVRWQGSSPVEVHLSRGPASSRPANAAQRKSEQR